MEMTQIGAFEAKTRFSELLREVEQGKSFEILRRGKPIACLTAIAPESNAERVAKVLAHFRESRRTSNITMEDILAWIEEGRR